jgi:hypothetical protein
MGEGGKKNNVFRILEGKPGGMSPLARPRYRWKNNNKIVHTEMLCGMYWIELAHDMDQCRAFVSMVMKLWVSYNVGKFSSIELVIELN